MDVKNTGDMPWDKADEEMKELYQKLFPKPRRRFTFTEVKKKYTYPKEQK